MYDTRTLTLVIDSLYVSRGDIKRNANRLDRFCTRCVRVYYRFSPCGVSNFFFSVV